MSESIIATLIQTFGIGGVMAVFAWTLMQNNMKQQERMNINWEKLNETLTKQGAIYTAQMADEIRALVEIRESIKSQIQAQHDCHEHIEGLKSVVVNSINKRVK